jgi:hypothetical protein
MKFMMKVAFEEWISKRRADDRLPRGPFFKGRIGGRENPLFPMELLGNFANRPYIYPVPQFGGSGGISTLFAYGARSEPRVTPQSLAQFMVMENDSGRYERALTAMLKDGLLSDRVHASEPDSDPQREKDFLASIPKWASVAAQVKNGMWCVPPLQGKTDIAFRMLMEHSTPETRFFMAEEPFEPFPRSVKPNAEDQADD